MNAALGLSHIAFDVAGFEVHHERGTAVAVVAQNRFDRLEGLKSHQPAQGHKSGDADPHRKLLDLLVVRAQFVRHPHDDVVTLFSLRDDADRFAAQGNAYCLVDLSRLEAILPKRFPIDVHQKLRRPSFRFELHLGHARRGFKNALDLFSELLEDVVVRAEDLHRELRLRPFEHLVEAHLDGLGEENVVVRIDLLQHDLDLLA